MSHSNLKILYIGGCSRSGSTLLERLLGQVHGFQAVGEMWHIWQRSFAENQLCGCNHPFRECDFWNAVVQEAFGGFQNVNFKEIDHLKHSLLDPRYLPLLAFPFLQTQDFKNKLGRFSTILSSLYQAVARISGCRVIVDSSKFPHYAGVLHHLPEVDLHVVHLVRDSRATAYSWQRKRVRPEVHWTTSYMDGHGPLGSSLEWGAINILLQSLQNSRMDYSLIRYEDFVISPRSTLVNILEQIGEDPSKLTFFNGENKVHLNVNHTVSGNPARFEQGEVKILPDDEWQQQMPSGHKLAVTALTWPLLLNYGYLGNQSYKGTVSEITDEV
jgi:hypothetical protein